MYVIKWKNCFNKSMQVVQVPMAAESSYRKAYYGCERTLHYLSLLPGKTFPYHNER